VPSIIDHRLALGSLIRPNATDKKSFSIEEVIKVDQANERAVATEIDEYIATESICDQFAMVFKEIAEAPAHPRELVELPVCLQCDFHLGKIKILEKRTAFL
jgi:hypothetical protein